MGRLLALAAIVAAAYWYWSGPYQAKVNPDYAQQLEANAEKMRLCIHGINYQLGATGEGEGNAEKRCAEKYNLYPHDGKWHSYDAVRREP